VAFLVPHHIVPDRLLLLFEQILEDEWPPDAVASVGQGLAYLAESYNCIAHKASPIRINNASPGAFKGIPRRRHMIRHSPR